MKFGAHLPTFWDDYGKTNVRVAVVEAARAAEALGYDAVWANDSVVKSTTEMAKFGPIGQMAEPFITLASLVYLLPRIKLGTSVLVLPRRNTVLAAKQAATLDLLSDGRLILGVGVGDWESEFTIMGADYANRAAINDEAIEVMQTLWREPVASFKGQYHRFDDAVMLSKPSRAGGPPIWIGGNTRAAIARTVQYGEAWIPYIFDLEAFQSGVATLRQLAQGQPCPTTGGYFNLRITGPETSLDAKTNSPWAPISIGGSPAEVAEAFEQFRMAGLEYAICLFESEDLDDYLRQIQLFAEEIVPQFDGSD